MDGSERCTPYLWLVQSFKRSRLPRPISFFHLTWFNSAGICHGLSLVGQTGEVKRHDERNSTGEGRPGDPFSFYINRN